MSVLTSQPDYAESRQQYWDDFPHSRQCTIPFQLDLVTPYLNSNSHILDYGCGHGRTLGELQQQGFNHLLGIDNSNHMLDEAKQRYPSIEFMCNTGVEIPCADAAMDCIIVIAVCTYMASNLELKQFLNEVQRVLKPGAYFLFYDFLLNQDPRNLARYQAQTEDYPYGVFNLPEGVLCRHFDSSFIQAQLNPYQVIHYSEQTFKTMNGHQSQGFAFVGKKHKD